MKDRLVDVLLPARTCNARSPQEERGEDDEQGAYQHADAEREAAV